MTLVDRLESGLNRRFVQYCDPIRPRDTLIQIAARAFTNAMRRLTLHPPAYHGRLSELSEEHRNELLYLCMQGLEYDVLLHSNPLIKHFQWKFQGFFQWSARLSFEPPLIRLSVNRRFSGLNPRRGSSAIRYSSSRKDMGGALQRLRRTSRAFRVTRRSSEVLRCRTYDCGLESTRELSP